MDKKYQKITDIQAYILAFELSNYVWNVVIGWNYLAKDTIGKQFIRAVDSISANIAEGFGRYYKKDKIQFYRYSFGSTRESLDWLEKSNCRKLLTLEQYNYIKHILEQLPFQINSLIKFTNLYLAF